MARIEEVRAKKTWTKVDFQVVVEAELPEGDKDIALWFPNKGYLEDAAHYITVYSGGEVVVRKRISATDADGIVAESSKLMDFINSLATTSLLLH